MMFIPMTIRKIIRKNKYLYKLSNMMFCVVNRIFFNSGRYWEKRYFKGGNSGNGSYGKLADFKAEVINKFIKDNNIKRVIEFGCGDGNQLSLFKCDSYIGLDVSKAAITICNNKFKNDKTKSFFLYNPNCFANNQKGELALSLDVIFHLIEDDIFERYMKHLFSSSSKFVIIYSSNAKDKKFHSHSKHRNFSNWIKNNFPKWRLIKVIKNKYPMESTSNFYVYKKEGY